MLEREARNKPAESIDQPTLTQASMVNRFADMSNNELAESMFQPKGNMSISMNTSGSIIQQNRVSSGDNQSGKNGTKQASHPRKIESKKGI